MLREAHAQDRVGAVGEIRDEGEATVGGVVAAHADGVGQREEELERSDRFLRAADVELVAFLHDALEGAIRIHGPYALIVGRRDAAARNRGELGDAPGIREHVGIERGEFHTVGEARRACSLPRGDGECAVAVAP